MLSIDAVKPGRLQVFQGYREWTDRVRSWPRNRKERRAHENWRLMGDAYTDRPVTKQQRMRSGTLPVLESRPEVTIDDTGR